MERYRVEGIGKRGRVLYVKVIGIRGHWIITGRNGLRIESHAPTVKEAIRRSKRQIPFNPIVIRPFES